MPTKSPRRARAPGPAAQQASAQLPRASRTRNALLEAGRRLIARGLMATASIDDIVREADVAKGSFFNHFSDKQELSKEVIAQVRAGLDASIRMAHLGVTDPAELLVRGLLTSFRYGMENRLNVRRMLYDIGETDIFAASFSLLAGPLQAGIDQKSFLLDDLESGFVLVLGIGDVGLSRLLQLRLNFPLARTVMRDLCVALLLGLSVEKQRIDRVVDEALDAIIDAPRREPKQRG